MSKSTQKQTENPTLAEQTSQVWSMPSGLEATLLLAAVEPRYEQALVTARQSALDHSGIALSAAERSVLDAVDNDTIRSLSREVALRLPPESRRAFLRQASKSLATLAAAGLLGASCKKDNPDKSQSLPPPITAERDPDLFPRRRASRPADSPRPSARASRPMQLETKLPGMRPVAYEQHGLTGIRPDRVRDKPSIYMKKVESVGGLDSATARRVVRRHLAEIQYCYLTVGLIKNPKLSGAVTITFHIDSKGHVKKDMRSQSQGFQSTRLIKCFESAARRWRFPRGKKARSSKVEFSFELKLPPR